MTWTQTLRQRWWLLPIAILVVASAIVIRIITTPLEVSANVNDGDQAVPRTATIDLHFNQEMKPASVQHAFTITPSVLFSFKAVGPKEFQFRPTMKPKTAYHVSLKDAQNTSGRGVSSGFSVKTEPAPAVAAVVVDNNTVADGQQAVKPSGEVKINFSQPMDGARTPISLNGKPYDKPITWAADGNSATLGLKLGHSRQYQLSIPQTAVNRKQDPLAADWKFSFTTVIEVPSQGDPATQRRLLASAPRPRRAGAQLPPDHDPARADVPRNDLLLGRQRLHPGHGLEASQPGERLQPRLGQRLLSRKRHALRPTQRDDAWEQHDDLHRPAEAGGAQLRHRP